MISKRDYVDLISENPALFIVPQAERQCINCRHWTCAEGACMYVGGEGFQRIEMAGRCRLWNSGRHPLRLEFPERDCAADTALYTRCDQRCITGTGRDSRFRVSRFYLKTSGCGEELRELAPAVRELVRERLDRRWEQIARLRKEAEAARQYLGRVQWQLWLIEPSPVSLAAAVGWLKETRALPPGLRAETAARRASLA